MTACGYIYKIVNASFFASLILLVCVLIVVWLGYSTIPGKTGYMIFFSASALFLWAVLCRLICGERESGDKNAYELLANDDITDEVLLL